MSQSLSGEAARLRASKPAANADGFRSAPTGGPRTREAPAGARGGWGWGFDLRDDTLTLSSSWRLWIQRVGEEKVAAHAIVKLGPFGFERGHGGFNEGSSYFWVLICSVGHSALPPKRVPPAIPPKAKTTTVSMKTASIGIAFSVHGGRIQNPPHCSRCSSRPAKEKRPGNRGAPKIRRSLRQRPWSA
jgi:hypothetical protein